MNESYAKALDAAPRSQRMSSPVAVTVSAKVHHEYVINGRKELILLASPPRTGFDN